MIVPDAPRCVTCERFVCDPHACRCDCHKAVRPRWLPRWLWDCQSEGWLWWDGRELHPALTAPAYAPPPPEDPMVRLKVKGWSWILGSAE